MTYIGPVHGLRAYLAGVMAGKVVDLNQYRTTRVTGRRKEKSGHMSR